MNAYQNKKVAILGFGIEGYSSALFLEKRGARITVLDKKKESELNENHVKHLKSLGVSFSTGQKYLENLNEFEVIVRSPAIPRLTQDILDAEKDGAEISSHIKLFFDYCPAEIIGVTGTKGKGTTSSLIFEILKKEGFDTYLGGNIGVPPLDFIDSLLKSSKVVLELSSFQLQDLHKSPHVAVMLMTTSEHLDYHRDVYEYIEAKRNILIHQNKDDFAILNKDYPVSNESDILSHAHVYKVSREQTIEQGCYVKDAGIYLRMNHKEEKIIDAKDVLLPGGHNLENICAAIMASLVSGASMKSIVPVLKSFKGLEYRLELIRAVNGVRYYNDSFSTTPETAIAAIEAFEDPEILILGGSSKNSDFTELGNVIDQSDNIKAIIGIGDEWENIKKTIHLSSSKIIILEHLHTMNEIVKRASEIGEIGDVVILSPACASFDMFKNYKDRGNQFNEAVRSL